MANALKKITTRAKEIYRKGGTWKSAIEKAGAEYRKEKKKPSARRKATRKKTARKKSAPRKKARARVGAIKNNRDQVDRKNVSITIGSVAHHKSQARIGIKNEIARKAGRRELAIKVNERKKLSREIAKLKKDYRALC